MTSPLDHDTPGLLPARLEAKFKRPVAAVRPLTRVLLFASITLGAAFGVSYLAHGAGLLQFLPWLAWVGVGALLGALAAWFFDRGFRVPERIEPIVLEHTRMLLPLGPASDRHEAVPLEQIESVDLVDRGRSPRLSIGTQRGLYVYPLRAFDPPKAALDLARAIVIAIAQRPGGDVQLAEMHRRQQVTGRFLRQRPRGTKAMLVLIALGFLAQHLAGAFEGPILEQQATLLRMGANASALVAEGQWWRLFTANFLHGGWLHIGLNGLALLSLGTVLEKLIGTTRFLVVYLASAVAGTLASAWAAQGPFSVGASTAIFGLLGAFGVVSLRFGKELPAGVRQSRRWWIIILGINGALPLVIPVIDMAAHAGGFVAGAVVVYLAYPSVERFDPGAPPSIGIRATALALVGVFAVAGITTARRAIVAPYEDPEALVLDLIAPTAPAELLNQQAWLVGTSSPAPSRKALEAARRAAARAVEQSRVSHYVDTLATVEHRLGHREEAARLEREAIALYAEEEDERWTPSLAGEEIFWSQLARFVRGPAGDAPPLVDGPVPLEEVRLGFEQEGLRVDAPAGRPLVAFAQLDAPEGPRGVLRVGLEPDAERPARFELDPALEGALAGQVDLHLFWVDTSTGALGEHERGLRFVPHDPEVDDLP